MNEKAPISDGQLERFAADVRATFGEAPGPQVRAAHLLAMAAESPLPAPASRRGATRSRTIRRGILVAGGLVLLGGSAMAATGTLPRPVQNVVADAVGPVVDLPGGSEEQPTNARGGAPTNPTAASNKAEADAFTGAKKEWLACMKESKGADPSASPAASPSDCGEKPHPRTFHADKTPKPDRTPKVTPPASDDGGSGNGGKGRRADRTPKPTRTPNPTHTDGPDGPQGSHGPDGSHSPQPTDEPDDD